MVSGCAIDIGQNSWIHWLPRISDMKPRPARTYDYSRAVPGVDYSFDKLGETDHRGYMTAQRRGVKVGDYILLAPAGVIKKYRIQQLDYYSSPHDMWIAFLSKVDK